MGNSTPAKANKNQLVLLGPSGSCRVHPSQPVRSLLFFFPFSLYQFDHVTELGAKSGDALGCHRMRSRAGGA